MDERLVRLLSPPSCDGATLPYTANDVGVFRSPHIVVEMVEDTCYDDSHESLGQPQTDQVSEAVHRD